MWQFWKEGDKKLIKFVLYLSMYKFQLKVLFLGSGRNRDDFQKLFKIFASPFWYFLKIVKRLFLFFSKMSVSNLKISKSLQVPNFILNTKYTLCNFSNYVCGIIGCIEFWLSSFLFQVVMFCYTFFLHFFSLAQSFWESTY